MCLSYIFTMSKCAEKMAWAVIFMIGAGLLTVTVVSIMGIASPNSLGLASYAPTSTFVVVAIVSSLCTLVYFLMLCLGYRQLKTAIDVIDASADFLRDTLRIIGLSVVFFLIQMVFFFLWMFALVCVMSMGDVKATPKTLGKYTPQARTFSMPNGNNNVYFGMMLYLIFALLWIVTFMKYKTALITMISASTYYFNSTEDKDGEAEVGFATSCVYKYHLGTIAFGSFLIALIEFIKVIFEFMAEQMVKASGENAAVKCLVCCGRCILNCFEKIIDYLSRAAFSYIAISGEGFCTGMYNGMLLNLKHGLEFAWANTLAVGFVWLGKISIVFLNVLIGYFIMKYITDDLDEMTNMVTPLAFMGIMTFISTEVFLGLFDEVVQALMTCLCVDRDMHGGEIKYGPKTFHDGIDAVNKKLPGAGRVADDQEKLIPKTQPIN